jgi:hypothetical protein
MTAETLAMLKGDFDSVRLVGKDDALELSLELWQSMGEDDHVLFYRKRHPDLGEGYVILPVPDPTLFDEDESLAEHALEMAQDAYDTQVNARG